MEDVRSGRINIDYGQFRYTGGEGYGWSSRSYDSSNAYYLGFNNSITGPSNGYNRYDGRPLRCLSTV